MINWFLDLNSIVQALIGTLFTWFVTAVGASFVFLFKRINKTVMDAMLGFAGGVMIAASFWSLLNPAIDMSTVLGMKSYIVVSIGFMCGGLFLIICDKIFNKCISKESNQTKRIFMLLLSITIHNIPEGLAVGVAFGSIMYGLDGATITAACLIALGIGLQNFPEGTIVSVPLRREGYSRRKSFFYGMLSGIVEPISGVIGAVLVLKVKHLLPFLLSFAAGAMIYVVVQELIPESQTNNKKSVMTLFTLIGFTIMMILDVALS